MKTTISVSSGFSEVNLLNNLLIACGIVSSLLYVAMNIFVPLQFPGYSTTSQTVSELSALGAPTRSLWVGWAFLYTFLVMAFAWGIWKSAGGNRRLRILALLLLIYGALGLVGRLLQCISAKYWLPVVVLSLTPCIYSFLSLRLL